MREWWSDYHHAVYACLLIACFIAVVGILSTRSDLQWAASCAQQGGQTVWERGEPAACIFWETRKVVSK